MSGSPIRCRGPWKLHKRAAEPDRWLDEMGFFRKHTARDASCLFRAVSENVYNTQRYFHKVRMECVEYMASKRHMFEGSVNTCPFDTYLKEISNPSEWGGLLEISAMSHLYRHDFVIFEANKGPQTKICNGYGNNIYLYYTPETKHFDTVYTKDFINTASYAQSLVYEMLYDGVYHLKDLPYAVDKMLYDKMPTNHIDYFMAENVERRKKQKDRAKIYIESSHDDTKEKNTLTLKCKHHTEDPEKASLLKESLSIFVFNRSLIQLENVCINCLNVNSAKDLIDNGITPFPYKVAKALDPDIYRNIEFDVWTDMRREMRYGTRYSDGMTLQVGVKCLCKLHPDQATSYHCHIQEMTPDGGPCLVFIEELGEKRVVNFKQLEPLSRDEARPWAPPYRYSRSSQLMSLSQMLQQIGNITRKPGPPRPRTKSKSFTDEPQRPEHPTSPKTSVKMPWNEELETTEINDFQMTPIMTQTPFNFTTYQHLDLVNFQPMPVEISVLPLMVDVRGGGGGSVGSGGVGELPVSAADGHHAPTQRTANGVELGGVTSPSARASTPASAQPTYTPGIPSGVGGMGINSMGGGMGAMSSYPCAPYSCGMKVWLAPPPLPPNVSPHVYKSIQPNGSDLPMNDIATLRYYFNLGVDCMWAAYGPPRHFSPRDLAQDMQQMTLHERPVMNNNGHEQNHKHKPPPLNDKHNNQGKGNGQRPLLGPRFKRGGNQDGGNSNNHSNHSNNHNQNKGHNNGNNINNKGPNNRRNSQSSSIPPGLPPPCPPTVGLPPGVGVLPPGVPSAPPHKYWEFGEPLPYVPYPPPYYTLPYYPIDAEQGMVSMVGGVPYGMYVEEGDMGSTLYAPPPYPPPLLPPPPPCPPLHHMQQPPLHEHK